MKPDRVPYAERPRVIKAHCTCGYVEVARTEAGASVERRALTDPRCPLHGTHAKEAPF